MIPVTGESDDEGAAVKSGINGNTRKDRQMIKPKRPTTRQICKVKQKQGLRCPRGSKPLQRSDWQVLSGVPSVRVTAARMDVIAHGHLIERKVFAKLRVQGEG